MKIELQDAGETAVITVTSSWLNATNVNGALEVVKLLADVEVKRLGILRRTTTISGSRRQVLAAGKVLNRHICEPVSKS
ncbi:MAG: hypothetical protein WCB03_08405 [Rouxiella badensis]|uniref:hypothetical protein n=1 Tax=Rouxiella badensis TaxID=1646377 RepID=UPI003C3C336E